MICMKYLSIISWIGIFGLTITGCKKDDAPNTPPPPTSPPPPPPANRAPEVRNSTISGNVKVAEKLTVRYTYFDAESDQEGGTAFQWYIADDTLGAAITPIGGATDSAYILKAADEHKFLRAGILPKAVGGASPGTETRSRWVGPVGAPEPTTITFMYNGQNVTYGILTSATTGRKWLDRNLGAPNAATGFNDWENEGDLFQWGRKADGHQLVIRGANTITTTAVNDTTSIRSSTNDPGHSLFIVDQTIPFDWHTPQVADLWQATGGVNNACPLGWHVPTKTEWEAEQLGSIENAYTKLKITTGGTRSFFDGKFSNTVNEGSYWTSDVFQTNTVFVPISFIFLPAPTPGFGGTTFTSAQGLSVRCIKD